MSEESFKVVVTRDLYFPDSPSGSHPHWCASDCSYCDRLESYDSACESIIEEAVEELENEFDAEVEHMQDNEPIKKKVLYWLELLVEDTKRAKNLAIERGKESTPHYGQALPNVKLEHIDAHIKGLELALGTAKATFTRGGY